MLFKTTPGASYIKELDKQFPGSKFYIDFGDQLMNGF